MIRVLEKMCGRLAEHRAKPEGISLTFVLNRSLKSYSTISDELRDDRDYHMLGNAHHSGMHYVSHSRVSIAEWPQLRML